MASHKNGCNSHSKPLNPKNVLESCHLIKFVVPDIFHYKNWSQTWNFRIISSGAFCLVFNPYESSNSHFIGFLYHILEGKSWKLGKLLKSKELKINTLHLVQTKWTTHFGRGMVIVHNGGGGWYKTDTFYASFIKRSN